ncbi:MAG: hypothetical protein HeimC3_24830 [Candidatus Heimdallarchaeota archaeon LC_3]|nr:MAG: hypothetical protein HeimC3_24830 [Candidatus Heimdallarchaeota archaeon LC_3]
MSQNVRVIKNRNKNSSTSNWSNLCNILNAFNVESNKDKLILNWDNPEVDQFEFIRELFSKLTETTVSGSYDGYSKTWVVKA